MKNKHKPVLPESYIKNHVRHIYYRTKPGNIKKHVYINDDDTHYIYYMLMRMIADLGDKQYTAREWFTVFTKQDADFSVSNYGKGFVKNSVCSYACGLLSNRYRNPSQDFTVKQLEKIEKLSTICFNMYHNDRYFVNGYDIATGEQNSEMTEIKFHEA